MYYFSHNWENEHDTGLGSWHYPQQEPMSPGPRRTILLPRNSPQDIPECVVWVCLCVSMFLCVLGVSPQFTFHSSCKNLWGKKVKEKVIQSCLTLCDLMDHTVHGIIQARILEWVAFPFSRRSSQPRDWTQVSHTAGGFFTSRATREAQEYWSG